MKVIKLCCTGGNTCSIDYNSHQQGCDRLSNTAVELSNHNQGRSTFILLFQRKALINIMTDDNNVPVV